MSETEQAVCDICEKDIVGVLVRKEDGDWYTETYHKECFDNE